MSKLIALLLVLSLIIVALPRPVHSQAEPITIALPWAEQEALTDTLRLILDDTGLPYTLQFMDNRTYQATITEQVANGEAPPVIIVDHTTLAALGPSLTAGLPNTDILNSAYSPYWQAPAYDPSTDTWRGLPIVGSIENLFWSNAATLPEPPATWPDLMSTAKTEGLPMSFAADWSKSIWLADLGAHYADEAPTVHNQLVDDGFFATNWADLTFDDQIRTGLGEQGLGLYAGSWVYKHLTRIGVDPAALQALVLTWDALLPAIGMFTGWFVVPTQASDQAVALVQAIADNAAAWNAAHFFSPRIDAGGSPDAVHSMITEQLAHTPGYFLPDGVSNLARAMDPTSFRLNPYEDPEQVCTKLMIECLWLDAACVVSDGTGTDYCTEADACWEMVTRSGCEG